MRVLLTGGTGLIGRSLIQQLVDRGDQVLAHTRKPRANTPGVYWFTGDSTRPETYAQAMASADAVVNLAGAPIACRWTEKAKATILKSRTQTTQALVEAAHAGPRPSVWVNASAVGYYGAQGAGLCDESAALGQGFLADVTAAWEAAALGAAHVTPMRLVRLRFGAVLAAHGGMLPLFVNAARAFVGGPLGSGEQPLSWIHITDAVRLILWCLDEPEVQGAINAVAPNPTQHGAFVKVLGQVMGRPMWLRTPPWALELAMGGMARELILGGQEVVPKAALQGGFAWRFPHLEAALRDLLVER